MRRLADGALIIALSSVLVNPILFPIMFQAGIDHFCFEPLTTLSDNYLQTVKGAVRAEGLYSYVVDGSFENYDWAVELGGSDDVMVSTSSLHHMSGEVALHLNTSLQEFAFVYQFLGCKDSTYKLTFWIYQESEFGETCVGVTSLYPWLEEREQSPMASIVIIRNNSLLVDAWRTTKGNDPPLKTLDCSLNLRTWHKIVFDADGVSMTQKVYVDDVLVLTLSSSSGTSFAPEILFVGDIFTSAGFGDFYYDDVDLVMDTPPALTVAISPPSATIQEDQTVKLTAWVSGGTPLYSYQWYIDNGFVYDAESDYLYFGPSSVGVHYVYVNVTDSTENHCVSQSAKLTVNPGPPYPPVPLTVSISPLVDWVEVNRSKTYVSTVSGGSPPYSYQWYLNNTPVLTATSSSWSLTPTTVGIYNIHLNVTDSNSTSVCSGSATLEVILPEIPVSRDYEIVEATDGGPYTVDPAFCYDPASGELLMNVYDTLLFLDGEHVDRLIPQLATAWTIENITGTIDAETGLKWYYRYVFQIRKGVQFHDHAFGNLTSEDVEYCFERVMVLDMDGGPQWMFYAPLLNGESATYVNQRTYDPGNSIADRVLLGKMIDHAVESNVTHVWFNLAFPGAYLPFMQILCQPWSGIYSKAWANALNRPTMWPGEWGDYTSWWQYHNPSTPPLDDPTPAVMGTGPFVFTRLDQLRQNWVVDRFPDYWRGWPINWPDQSSQPAGYVDRFRVTWAYDWATRSQMFLNGEVDFCAVPRQHIPEVLGQDGIRCIHTLPSLSVNAEFFTFEVNMTTPYGTILPSGVFGETGIPTDFFGNTTWGMHTRKAFAHAFDYDTYIAEAYLGEAQHPQTAIIPGLLFYDPSVKGYAYNLTQAAEEFKKVPGLWDTGFTMTLVYATRSVRSYYPELIKSAIESLNPKFHIALESIPWSEIFPASSQHQLPIFVFGYLSSYPDPYEIAFAFYHSEGIYPTWQLYSNPNMDALIDASLTEPDTSKRAAIYHDIQILAVEDCSCMMHIQPVGRHFERDWICGWHYNPGYLGVYAANLWKWYYLPHALFNDTFQPISNYLSADVNYDGSINIIDITIVAQAFGSSYGPPLHRRWNFRADINNDRIINILDLANGAKYFGKKCAIWVSPSQYPPISDP